MCIMEDICSKKRGRFDSYDIEFNSQEVKRIKVEDLKDDKFYKANEEWDSFMKSFEEDISSRAITGTEPSTVVDSRSELGYLLEASDDELGLPPCNHEEVDKAEWSRVSSDHSSELSGGKLLWNFEPELPSFELFDGGDYDYDYVALDALFDYSDLGVGLSDLTWSGHKSETFLTNQRKFTTS